MVSEQYCNKTRAKATRHGYSNFKAWLTTGGDDRSLILASVANKYHIRPQPIGESEVFCG